MFSINSKWFSSIFQSSMTIFHHKLPTREDRVLTNGWTQPSSMTILANLFINLKSYHSDNKYHMTLNIIFCVVFWSERRQITLYHIDFTMHIHLYITHLYSPQLPTSGLLFQNITKTYREIFFYEGGPHLLIGDDDIWAHKTKENLLFPSSTSFPSFLLFLFPHALSSFLPCAFLWGFHCPHVHCAHWNYSTCQDCGCVFYGQSRSMHVWSNENMKEHKTCATTAPNIPFSECGANFKLSEVYFFTDWY